MFETRVPKSMSLDADDIHTLAELQTPDTSLRSALKVLLAEAGLPEPDTESAVLHTLLVLGRRAVEEQAQLTGYAAYAASLDDKGRAVGKSMRRRSAASRKTWAEPRSPLEGAVPHVSTSTPSRGHVYLIADDEEIGPKPFLVVSNNARNQRLDNFLAVRLTASVKPELATIVELDSADRPLVGRVLCDDLHTLFRDEILKEMGGLSSHTLLRVNAGLCAALTL